MSNKKNKGLNMTGFANLGNLDNGEEKENKTNSNNQKPKVKKESRNININSEELMKINLNYSENKRDTIIRLTEKNIGILDDLSKSHKLGFKSAFVNRAIEFYIEQIKNS